MAKAAIGLVLTLALMGCGNAPGISTSRTDISNYLKRDKGPAKLQLSAAAVAASPAPLVEIRTKTRQSVAIKVAENGGVASFASADGIGLGLRDRMPVSVKGLHSDVISASAPSAARLSAGEGAHQRSYHILNGVGELEHSVFNCTVSRHPAEEITVADRSRRARVVAETCQNSATNFVNKYWFDETGRILQSDQWIGSGVDFMRLSFG